MTQPAPEKSAGDDFSAERAPGVPLDDWSGDDLEQLYQEALEAVDAVESQIELSRLMAQSPDSAAGEQGIDAVSASRTGHSADVQAAAAKSAGRDHRVGAARPSVDANAAARERLTPEQVIEAALFVGGAPLSTKKLGSLLNSHSAHEVVDLAIERLNHRYAAQARPYEIRLGPDGYRMLLRPEFERVSHRVHGYGPKEVKLSQESLEILALIAYRQPITAAEIEQAGRPNAGSVVRQLLRRELIVIERRESSASDVAYRTTPRFLEVFGIRSLDELPQADELDLK